MKAHNLIFILFAGLSFSFSANAYGTPVLVTSQVAYCHDQNVRRIIRPVQTANQKAGQFSFAYKMFSTAKTDAPTVVVIPGGPGQTLLEHNPSEAYPLGVVPPSDFNIVYTEPRGAGCNQLSVDDFPVQGLTTDEVALDIVAVVADLKLTNYIIYGASFGTVAATKVAYFIHKQKLPAPKAVVLEGTLGKAFPGGFKEYFAGYQVEWDRVKTLLPAMIVQSLSDPNLLLGYDANVWGLHIFQRLIPGDIPHYGHFLQYDLWPVAQNDAAGIQRLKTILDGIKTNLPYYSVKTNIFKALGCQELFGSWGKYIFLQNGELAYSEDVCGGFKYDNQYDSKNWQISVPIIYFQGPFDPATPIASARYHFENQTSSKRLFVAVDKAAHAPLSGSLYFLKCSAAVWNAIGTDFNSIEDSLKTCGDWKISAERK